VYMCIARISLLIGEYIGCGAIYRTSGIVLNSFLVDGEGPGSSEVRPADVGGVGNLRSLEGRAWLRSRFKEGKMIYSVRIRARVLQNGYTYATGPWDTG